MGEVIPAPPSYFGRRVFLQAPSPTIAARDIVFLIPRSAREDRRLAASPRPCGLDTLFSVILFFPQLSESHLQRDVPQGAEEGASEP